MALLIAVLIALFGLAPSGLGQQCNQYGRGTMVCPADANPGGPIDKAPSDVNASGPIDHK